MEYNGTTTLKADPPTRFGFLWGLITTNNHYLGSGFTPEDGMDTI